MTNATIKAKYNVILNSEEVQNERTIDTISINVDKGCDFTSFIDICYDSIKEFKQNIQRTEELFGIETTITGISIRFTREDGSVIDDIPLSSASIDDAKRLVSAFSAK